MKPSCSLDLHVESRHGRINLLLPPTFDGPLVIHARSLGAVTFLPHLEALDTEYFGQAALSRYDDVPAARLRELTVRTSSVHLQGFQQLWTWIRRLTPRPSLESFTLNAFSTQGDTLIPRGFLLDMEDLRACAGLISPGGDLGRVDWDGPRLSPMRHDLRAMPPALITAAGVDPLRDQAYAYAAALHRAEAPVRAA